MGHFINKKTSLTMTEFRNSLDTLLKKHEHTTGFAVIEESGLRIGSNGTLKNANIMILNDIFAAARNIIDFTNELFNEPQQTAMSQTAYNGMSEDNMNLNGNDENMQNEGQQNVEKE